MRTPPTLPPEDEARRLVHAYSDLILRLSYTYLKSTQDAEDICQDVLMKLVVGNQTFQSAQHEKAWVIRVTANACKDALRLGERRHRAPLDEASQAAAPEPPSDDVLDAVMALPQKYREAIYLHYYEGYSIGEIARITGRSIAAVAAHLSRGRAELRADLSRRSICHARESEPAAHVSPSMPAPCAAGGQGAHHD